MMSCVFKKKDFELCSLPVPVGYPQSQTHASIGLLPNKCTLLVTSPYPNIKMNILTKYSCALLRRFSKGRFCSHSLLPEYYENPLIYISCENSGFPHTQFSLCVKEPLDSPPFDKYGLGTYCSDPDLYVSGEEVYILNRKVVRTPQKDTLEVTVALLYGKFISGNFIFYGELKKLVVDDNRLLSPCFIFYNREYLYTYLISSSYNTGNPCDSLVIRKDKSLQGDFHEKKNVKIICGDNYTPWHMSLFQWNGKLYSILACIKVGKKQRCYQMLGEFSSDLNVLKIFKTPLTELRSYRGSAYVTTDGLFVLYSTTDQERMKKSNSVDGRDVIMASIQMDQLISKLTVNE